MQKGEIFVLPVIKKNAANAVTEVITFYTNLALTH